MSLKMLKSLSQALALSSHDAPVDAASDGGAEAESSVVRPTIPAWTVPRRDPAPIVYLPVGEAQNAPEPRAVATADMKVKQFRDHRVEEERYTATLWATSDAPAMLLAALADAAGEIEELGSVSGPDEGLIMHITIRR
jgi:hypothetical protein